MNDPRDLFGVEWGKLERAGEEMGKLGKAGLMVRVASFSRLKNRYLSQYDDEAKKLAVAVVNELFSDESKEGTPAASFIREHGDVVEGELKKLKDDKELLLIVHHTLSHEIGLRHAYGESAEKIEQSFLKLKNNGLLVPTEPLRDEEFLHAVNVFYENNIQNGDSVSNE